MKIFVISLPDAIERRISAKGQLDEAGVEFSFFDGIDGAAAWRCFSGYDSLEYRINTGRPAVPGEVGCFASHATLWQRCIELNEAIIIMEDDFYAHQKFASAVAQLDRWIDDFGFVRLEETSHQNILHVMNCGEFSLSYCQKYPHGATCYAISPRIAKEFVARSEILRKPVDKFIRNFWEHDQPLYSLQPAPIMRQELPLQSGNPVCPDRPLPATLRLRRMARKAVRNMRRARFNARMIKQAQRRSGLVIDGAGPAPYSSA